MTLTGPYSVALPFLVRDYLHADVSALGLLYAVFPIGYVLGSIWLGGKTTMHASPTPGAALGDRLVSLDDALWLGSVLSNRTERNYP